jgi:hypothetical protein
VGRSAEAFGQRHNRAPRKLALATGPPGGYDAGRRDLQDGEVRLVEHDRQEAVTEEALARRRRSLVLITDIQHLQLVGVWLHGGKHLLK